MKGRIRWKQIGPAPAPGRPGVRQDDDHSLDGWRAKQEATRRRLRHVGMLFVLAIGLGVLACLIIAIRHTPRP
jgi:hypothetical protein